MEKMNRYNFYIGAKHMGMVQCQLDEHAMALAQVMANQLLYKIDIPELKVRVTPIRQVNLDDCMTHDTGFQNAMLVLADINEFGTVMPKTHEQLDRWTYKWDETHPLDGGRLADERVTR